MIGTLDWFSMAKGFIELDRGIFSHWLWKERRVYSKAEAWLDIVRSARYGMEPHKDLVNGKLIEVNRGEWCASVRFLAERWRWGKSTVHSFIKLLKKEDMIRTDLRTGENVIIVCNYDTYNRLPDSSRTAASTAGNTPSGQAPDKVEEGEKKEKKESVVACPYQDIADLWISICCPTLPKISPADRWPDSLRRKVRSRWLESNQSIDRFSKIFRQVAASDFLTQKWGKANFQWVMKPENWLKVDSGNYENKGKESSNPHDLYGGYSL